MNRKLASAIVIIGLLASPMTPANAIFGKSECEKVKNKMLHEESVGLLYFKDFAKQRSIFLKMANPKRSNAADVLSWVGSVFESDLKVYAFVEKNTTCFSAKQVIDARNRTLGTTRLASEVSYKRMTYAYKISESANFADIDYIKKVYPAFYSFFNINKKLA